MNTIDLFDQGTGLTCLQNIYNLSCETIRRIEDNIFNYKTKPMSDEEIEDHIRFMISNGISSYEDHDLWYNTFRDRSRIERDPVEDCIQVFINETGINLNEYDTSNIYIRCKHVTASLDGGESIRKYGLLNLNSLLENESVLSKFLRDRGIIIIPSQKIFVFNERKYKITNDGALSSLYHKLYSDKGEIEVFISATNKTMKEYSCVRDYPEILLTISEIIDNKRICFEWKEMRKDILRVEFDIPIKDCIIHKMKDKDYFPENNHYTLYDNTYRENAIRNIWIIKHCLYNATKLGNISELYAAIKPGVPVKPEMINIIKIG